MNAKQRVGLGVAAVLAILVVRGQVVSRQEARSMSSVAAAACKGVPSPAAPPYERDRRGIHRAKGDFGRSGAMWNAWKRRVPVRWFAERTSELELVLCFAYEQVVVDTCQGYVGEGGRAASDIVLAKERWSVRVAEARTGRVVDTLRREGRRLECPRTPPASLTYLVDRAFGPESDFLEDWVRRFVEPVPPGPR
jgi:hypothetical protein